jgi:hypothetical protein
MSLYNSNKSSTAIIGKNRVVAGNQSRSLQPQNIDICRDTGSRKRALEFEIPGNFRKDVDDFKARVNLDDVKLDALVDLLKDRDEDYQMFAALMLCCIKQCTSAECTIKKPWKTNSLNCDQIIDLTEHMHDCINDILVRYEKQSATNH